MTIDTTTERIHVDHSVAKHLGNWTRADHIEVRARRGAVVVDLRSPELPGEIEIRLDLHHAMVKLLVGDDVAVSHWDLGWTGKGKIKDSGRVPEIGTRTVRLVGSAADSEVRVHRGGVAILSAMCSRAYLQDLRRAHATGDAPTVDDPARTSH